MAVYGYLESFVWSLRGSKLMISPPDASLMVFGYTIIIGFLLAIFYGAPAYALLGHKRKVTWWAILLVGLIPGVAVWSFVERSLGGWSIVCGIAVAYITHFLSKRFFAENEKL
jgi:hypothetical protein